MNRAMRRSLSLRFAWIAALTALIAFAIVPERAAAQGGEPQTFAIRGATIVPVSGPRIESGTVIVAHGVITAVGKDVNFPQETWVIDGKGLTVYPGLIDSFTDVGLVSPPAAEGARSSAPPSRGPEDRPASTPWRDAAGEATLSDKRIETWRDGGFTTVISAHKGGIFPGQAALLDLGGERNGDLVVKSPVAIPVSLQAPGNFASFPGSLMGTLGYVHQVWLDTEWSGHAESIYDKNPKGMARPRYDRTDSALADALEDHAVVLIPANTTIQIRRSFELVDLWKVPAVLYGGQMSYDVAGEIAAKKLPVLVNLKWPEAEKDADPDKTPTLRTLRFRDLAPSSPAALAKANVKFAFYSGGAASPKDVLKAAKKSIDAGLSADAAIRALTLSSAEIFGVSDRLGSIETGKIANLVITDGDIFGEKTKIKYVFVDGRKYTIHQPEKPKDPPKGDLTGKWKLSFTSPEGPDEATADISMASDGTLSGSVASKRGTSSIIEGYLSADKFSFKINIPIEDSPSDVIFSGTFDGKTMKGNIHVASVGVDIDFTGAKPNEKSMSAADAESQAETESPR
ncbi:MAG TPA: amidohydrolase family protein [Candidatus Acidoferrum sp.]|jgi:imidazolonepropionase-like amidohydrolase